MATLLDTVTQATERPLVVRFAGDSGDGIQLAGYEFARTTADAGADFMTFPDYPAEIRAPAGTTFGVSAFQIQFGPGEVLTPGDEADVLVAFNPAALKTNLQYLKRGGLLIVDDTHFDARGLKKAGVESNPLEDGSLGAYRVVTVGITKRALEALASLDLGRKYASRARNFWALGLVYWLFGRDISLTVKLLERKFAGEEEVLNANLLALKAGHAHGETIELAGHEDLAVRPAAGPARGRIISGTQAMALGIAAIPALSQREVIYCSYPITPASALLHALARYDNGVSTFQAEDEIAAASAAIGASYGGALGITASSGPGLALKTEAIGLAVMAELPLVVIDVQRAGPSTGMPTKPEQADLTMAIHGRHGESPLPVFAPATPEDCFWVTIEAARTAIEAMTPVIVLSDAYLANAASDWIPPDVDSIPDITVPRVEAAAGGFKPYARDEATLARSWVTPGTRGFAHRIGGIEKQAGSGHISYDPANHEEMVRLRAEKIARIAERRPAITLEGGAEDADILVIGWGSTYGAIKQAVLELNAEGKRAAHVHLRQLWPLPRGLGELLDRFPRAVTAEMNAGQLASILRSEYLKPVGHIGNITGQPFRVRDLKSAIAARLEG